MILILSEEKDITTDIVCNWLNYNQIKFIRLNDENTKNVSVVLHIGNGDSIISFKNNEIQFELSQICKTWFRRGNFNFMPSNKIALNLDRKAVANINQHIDSENQTLVHFLYHYLKQKSVLNDPRIYNSNKLITLFEAQKAGLLIPSTLITDDVRIIKDFSQIHTNCITKNIQDILFLNFENGLCTSQSTQKVNWEEITESKYWYSLFQKEIEKKYELRIFYLLGKFFTLAIFSQMDKRSCVDFREVDVNNDRPNRLTPFILPKPIKLKLIKLMKKLKLESGSIDMIVDKEDNYYFLEVNPVGQFDFLSRVGNFYIEKEIAEHLLI